MTEYGIFFPEGCIERQLWTKEEAAERLAYWKAEGETDAWSDELCPEPDHDDAEQPRSDCELCRVAEASD